MTLAIVAAQLCAFAGRRRAKATTLGVAGKYLAAATLALAGGTHRIVALTLHGIAKGRRGALLDQVSAGLIVIALTQFALAIAHELARLALGTIARCLALVVVLAQGDAFASLCGKLGILTTALTNRIAVTARLPGRCTFQALPGITASLTQASLSTDLELAFSLLVVRALEEVLTAAAEAARRCTAQTAPRPGRAQVGGGTDFLILKSLAITGTTLQLVGLTAEVIGRANITLRARGIASLPAATSLNGVKARAPGIATL